MVEKISGFNFSSFAAHMDRGARANLFLCQVTLPQSLRGSIVGSNEFDENFSFLCRATNVPSFEIGRIEVPFKGGRKLKIDGDREVPDWNITVIGKSDWNIYNAFVSWQDAVNGNVETDSVIPDTLDYMGTGNVMSLDKNGNVLQQWKLEMIWPSSVGEITYDWSSNDTIIEFPVTLVTQWVEVENVTRNNA